MNFRNKRTSDSNLMKRKILAEPTIPVLWGKKITEPLVLVL
jgi:hypothetical protein